MNFKPKPTFPCGTTNSFYHIEFTVKISSKSMTSNSIILSFLSYFGWNWLQGIFQKTWNCVYSFFRTLYNVLRGKEHWKYWGSHPGWFGMERLIYVLYHTIWYPKKLMVKFSKVWEPLSFAMLGYHGLVELSLGTWLFPVLVEPRGFRGVKTGGFQSRYI